MIPFISAFLLSFVTLNLVSYIYSKAASFFEPKCSPSKIKDHFILAISSSCMLIYMSSDYWYLRYFLFEIFGMITFILALSMLIYCNIISMDFFTKLIQKYGKTLAVIKELPALQMFYYVFCEELFFSYLVPRISFIVTNPTNFLEPYNIIDLMCSTKMIRTMNFKNDQFAFWFSIFIFAQIHAHNVKDFEITTKFFFDRINFVAYCFMVIPKLFMMYFWQTYAGHVHLSFLLHLTNNLISSFLVKTFLDKTSQRLPKLHIKEYTNSEIITFSQIRLIE